MDKQELTERTTAILNALAGSLSLDELTEMVTARDLTELDQRVERAYALVAEAALAAFLTSLGRVEPHRSFVADTSTWRISQGQSQMRALILGTLSRRQKELLRLILAQAPDVPAPTIAMRLRNALGLTEAQYGGIERYEKILASPTRSELEKKDLTTPQQVAVMTSAQARMKRAERGAVIGHIEHLRATGRAEHEAWTQATELSFVGRVRRIWNIAGHNTRDSHFYMSSQERGLDEAFDSGAGHSMMYPGDPAAPVSELANCNCWLTYVV